MFFSIFLHLSLNFISLSYLEFFFEILHLVFLYLSISPFPIASLISSAICIVYSVNHFVTFLFFTFGIHFSAGSITISRISIPKYSGFLPSTCSILNLFLISTVYLVSMFAMSFFGAIFFILVCLSFILTMAMYKLRYVTQSDPGIVITLFIEIFHRPIHKI